MHFTRKLLKEIETRGVEVVKVTLHVGLSTFEPIKSENIPDHRMYSEYFSVSRESLQKIIKAKSDNRRIIAAGITITRVLKCICDDCLIRNTRYVIRDLSGQTDIFIYPGYRFKCIDGLIINFHLPESSLILLVFAFAGGASIKNAKELSTKNIVSTPTATPC